MCIRDRSYNATKIGTARVRYIDWEQADIDSGNTSHYHSTFATSLYDIRTDQSISGEVHTGDGLSDVTINLPPHTTSFVNNAYTGATVVVNTTFGANTTSDTVTITGRVDSSIVPSATETNSLGSSTLRWDTIFAKDGNFSGDITLGGNITVGDGDTDSITINADLTSNLIPDVNNTYDIGSATKKWRTVHANQILGLSSFSIGNLSFSSNSISNTASNQNITLDPMGTGTIVVPSISVSNLKLSARSTIWAWFQGLFL